MDGVGSLLVGVAYFREWVVCLHGKRASMVEEVSVGDVPAWVAG